MGVNIGLASVTVGTITSSSTYPLICHDSACATYGYVNMRPTIIGSSGYNNVTITDNNISGLAYGNEIGWINFAPTIYGTATPVKVDPNTGAITGYAYSQIGSWINFNPTTVSSGTQVGVRILSNGAWDGWAWVSGNRGGWLHYDCNVPATCVMTDWRSISNRPSTGGSASGGGGVLLPGSTGTTTASVIINNNNTNSNVPPSATSNSNNSYIVKTNPNIRYVTLEEGNRNWPSFVPSNWNIPGKSNISTQEAVTPFTPVTEYYSVFPNYDNTYIVDRSCLFCIVSVRDMIGKTFSFDGSGPDSTANSNNNLAPKLMPVYNVPILKIAAVPKSLEIRVSSPDIISQLIQGPSKQDLDLTSVAIIVVGLAGLWRMILVRAFAVFLKL